MTFTLDFSTARPGAAAIQAAGAVGVLRYIGVDERPGSPKLITRAEVGEYVAAKLDLGIVWETTANEMDGGMNAGIVTGLQARSQVQALGLSRIPIYFANDQRVLTVKRAHIDFMVGVLRSQLREQTGAYGPGPFLDACADELGLTFLWHVATWGSCRAPTLTQEPNIASPIPDTDYNTVHTADWGQWPRPLDPHDKRREAALLWTD